IDLFAGKTVEFTNLKKSSLPSSGSILTAYVDGKMGDTITLIYRDGVITGNFTVDGQQYQLRFVGEQDGQALHVLHEIDPARYPQEHPSEFASGAVKPFNIQGARQDLSTDSAFDDGTSIDVMVVYTPAARLAAGGTTAMLNLIDLAVSETNAGYGNSGINTNLNLVNAHEVSYTETGSFYTDLSRLEGTSDGYIDGIHTIRDQVQADMVGMIIEDTQYCGLASAIMASASTAFQVTARTCATGYYSFAHEFGHLQGARHDWRVDPTNNSPFTYNHGYVKADQGWRTIMAYNDSGACSGGYCARLQYWSNPDVTYGAYPMGVSEGSTNAADNRKTLNQT
ncbi:MAG: peptidyl-Asp metalloendopeptidase, partial [Desulfobacterales bacterium]|nr:peptidyl-Asp metalloendopeptidase [Desulfobacterales bacterium]